MKISFNSFGNLFSEQFENPNGGQRSGRNVALHFTVNDWNKEKSLRRLWNSLNYVYNQKKEDVEKLPSVKTLLEVGFPLYI